MEMAGLESGEVGGEGRAGASGWCGSVGGRGWRACPFWESILGALWKLTLDDRPLTRVADVPVAYLHLPARFNQEGGLNLYIF